MNWVYGTGAIIIMGFIAVIIQSLWELRLLHQERKRCERMWRDNEKRN